ncbi:LysR family transcriptional regulator [Paraburkholderia tropica]|uniref:LysR family transcriptional regulator n=1 Tax=Paraburkholderia tropica TaxID=92647 RepID=UPI002AB655CF|nr:LysR family transcriptional regulator [Paraburkholderia tropica]
MEFRQLRYFAGVIEHGSMGKAALELGVGTSALSQQISRLEGELATRLLQRTATGVVPTDAGLAFWRQAQLALRHFDGAALAAREARLAGQVSVGMPPSTGGIVGLRFMLAMQERYPNVSLRIVESLSGHLGKMLASRQIDLAVLFREEPAQHWSVHPILDEALFLIGSRTMPGMPSSDQATIADVAEVPLLMPSSSHGLRALVSSCFSHVGREPKIVAEIDGLAILMDAVLAGLGATIQPGAALARTGDNRLQSVLLNETRAMRPNLVVSLSDDELSPPGLAARVVLADVMRTIVLEKRWHGARLR